MDAGTAQSWVLIITAVAGGIGSIIAAIKSNRSAIVGKANKETLDTLTGTTDVIKTNTDGNITDLRKTVRNERAINTHLVSVISALVDQLPPGSLMRAQKELERLQAEIGHRRANDQREFETTFAAERIAPIEGPILRPGSIVDNKAPNH